MERFPYIPRGDSDEEAMLRVIGAESFEDLIAPVHEHLRLNGPLDLPPPRSEYEVARIMEGWAGKNFHGGAGRVFLGAGSYDHFVPAAVDHLSFRSEFYTAYTPYQAEVAQGTLTTIFEFQTMMSGLTGMDLANASLYDGATALAEAALLAASSTRKTRIVVAGPMHPHYLQVLRTLCGGQNLDVVTDPSPDGIIDRGWLRDALSGAAAVAVQSPNFYGIVEDLGDIFEEARAQGIRGIQVFEPHALPLYRTPGEMGADLAVGEGLSLGTSPSYGGPALGLFAARQEFVRRIPGRLIGETVDRNGERAFVMTLRTREQDIRRERATSNICTNQGLLALRATIYLSLMGPEGMTEVAEQCLERAHHAAEELSRLDGFEVAFSAPFFHEFVLTCPRSAEEVVRGAMKLGVIPGVPLSRFPDLDIRSKENQLLVCVTEKHLENDLRALVEAVKEGGRG